MKYETRVWKPFNRDSYRWAWKDKKLIGVVLLCQHFAQTKMSKTRTKRGTGWTGGAV